MRGYKCLVFTITDKQSKEKVDLLKAFGAEVIVCPTAVAPEDPRSYYSVAKKLAREIPNSFTTRDKYENPPGIPRRYYCTTGPESLGRTPKGKVTPLRLRRRHWRHDRRRGSLPRKEKNPAIKVIGVDPYRRSLYYEFFKTGNVGRARTYVVEGIGEDIFPSTMDFKILDDIVQVTDQECFVWARRLVKERRYFYRWLRRRLRFGGAPRRTRIAGRELRGGLPPRYRYALPEQGL